MHGRVAFFRKREMTKRPGRKYWILILVLGGFLFYFLYHRPEPTYGGKSASYWLEQMDPKTGRMKESFVAFKAMGSNAVPFLVEKLEWKPWRYLPAMDRLLYDDQTGLPKRLPKILVRILSDDGRNEALRDRAFMAIREIGPEASAAIPTLMKAFNDTNGGWQIRNGAEAALGAMGEKLAGQTPVLIKQFKEGDANISSSVAMLLGKVGPKAEAALPILIEATSSTNDYLCIVSADAIWSIARQTNFVIGVYTRLLRSTKTLAGQKYYPGWAISRLGAMGSAARSTAPMIQKLMLSPGELSRSTAEAALREVDPDRYRATIKELNEQGPALIAKAIEALHSEKPEEQKSGLYRIQIFGPAARESVPAIVRILETISRSEDGPDKQYDTTIQAADALAEIGPEARAAVPVLTNLLSFPKGIHISRVCRALGCIGPAATGAVPALEAWFTNNYPDLQLAAATAVTRIVPGDCSNAVAVLRGLQRDSGEIANQETPEQVEEIMSHRIRFYPSFQAQVAVALWRLGLKSDLEESSPMAALVKQLNSPGNLEFLSLIRLAGDLGPDAKGAIPRLKAYMDNGPFSQAAIAIRKIDPEEYARMGLPGTLVLP